MVLSILLLSYYVLTLSNAWYMNQQVEKIGEHPYTVAIAVGQVNTGIVQMRRLPERLVYMRSSEVVDGVRDLYTDIDAMMQQNMAAIQSKYIYHPEDAAQLRDVYADLSEDQVELLALCEDPAYTGEDAKAFYTDRMEPKLDRMEQLTESMVAGSQVKLAEFERLAGQSRLSTVLGSTILTLAVIATLAIYQYMIKGISKHEEAMRDALGEALASAQNANAAKSQFLFNMSHDIRTPMNAIIGMTAIATLNQSDPARVKDCLQKISASSKHLLGLINDILDMSKIENGKIALNQEPFGLPELIDNFIVIVQPQAKARQLELEVSVSQLEHEQVIGDTVRISQVLLNLVSNAVKFTQPGGQVLLSIQELPVQHRGYATYQFVVSDTGVGMPADFLPRIFEPFERQQTSTHSKIEGTGLGMAITKSIVDMMNGQIEVESELGKGTTFTVTLHLKLQQDEALSVDMAALRELRALVVDDDQDVCINTVHMLEEIGMESQWVLSGAEAVDHAVSAHEQHRDFHSVIIDWKMPGMDGLETTRRIRSAVGDEVPIIILTAYDWSDIEQEAKAAGVNAFLAKPLFKSRLYQVLHDVVLGEAAVPCGEPAQQQETPLTGCVLLVEDNAMNMEIAQEFICRSGAKVERAWDGLEAVDRVAQAPEGAYQLVLMDLQMPRLDGYAATRQIREFEQSQGRAPTPIVAMSANAFLEDIDRAYTAGMDAYITKPVSMDEVHRILRQYLGSHGANAAS